MATASKKCDKCQTELVKPGGIHMGIPFGHWTYRHNDHKPTIVLVCARCYDEMTVVENIQRTGDELV